MKEKDVHGQLATANSLTKKRLLGSVSKKPTSKPTASASCTFRMSKAHVSHFLGPGSFLSAPHERHRLHIREFLFCPLGPPLTTQAPPSDLEKTFSHCTGIFETEENTPRQAKHSKSFRRSLFLAAVHEVAKVNRQTGLQPTQPTQLATNINTETKTSTDTKLLD